jgi:hypothetical protein
MDRIIYIVMGLMGFLSTQLAGNILTLATAFTAGFVYIRQMAHGNHVRDLQYIASQRHLLSSLARHTIPAEQLPDYDADEILAALEETAHAFNAGLVGRVAVDYLKPGFILLTMSLLRLPLIRKCWARRDSAPHFSELVKFMRAEGICAHEISIVGAGDDCVPPMEVL